MPAPREVVINTGPLLALAAAGELAVLPEVFTRVWVPGEVRKEILAGGRTEFAREEILGATWLEVPREALAVSPFLRSVLDSGEAAVIATALTRGIGTVCIDEVLGRRYARLHGLGVTGSLGVLLQAKRSGAPLHVGRAIARMKARGIWIGLDLEKEALRLAGE